MDMEPKHLAQEKRHDCPRARPFRPPTEPELLLGRMERAVDEIVTAVATLGSTDSAKAQDHVLRVAGAARRLSGLASRWQREVGR